MARRLSRGLLVIVAIVLVVMLAAGGFLFATGVIPPDTTSKHYTVSGWTAVGAFTGSEFFDSPRYVAGFYADHQSENMFVDGYFARQEINCFDVVGYRWTITFTSAISGQTITLVDFIDSTGLAFCPDRVGVNGQVAHVDGNDYGTVRVTLGIAFQGGGPHNACTRERVLDPNQCTYATVGEDRAAVQPGFGKVTVLNGDKLVAVGEKLRIKYDVGAATSSSQESQTDGTQGWVLTVLNRDTGTQKYQTRLADFTSATLEVPVTTDWFTIGAKNEYTARLDNQLMEQNAVDFVTIDDRTLAPGTPTIVITPGPYQQGMSVTITASSSPNSQTGNPIQSYHFIVRQGGVEIADQDSTANAITFVIPDEQVDISGSVIAFDGERSSGVKTFDLTVEDADANRVNSPTGGSALGIPLWIYFVLIGIALIVLAVFLKIIPITFRLIIVLVGVVFILLAVIFFG
jgi:hypothetical protein